MLKVVNTAVIGLGMMGQHHARNLATLPLSHLTAVADIDVSRAKKIGKKYNCSYFSDYRKLLLDKNISTVTVAAPTPLHFQIAKDCLLLGKHVLVEKPITDNIKDAETLITLARKKHLLLAVGHLERFNPALIELKNRLIKKEIGKVVTLSSVRVGIYPPAVEDTDVITDLAIHDIDIFNYLLSKKPQKIYCIGGKAIETHRDDHAGIILTYGKSLNGIIQVNWITPVKIRLLSVTGTHGYMELDYINQKLRLYKRRKKQEFYSFNDFISKFGSKGYEEIRIVKREPLREELTKFIECIRLKEKFPADGHVGLEALKIANQAKYVLRNLKVAYDT